ncbi:hypothetical protein MPH_06640 [Macrophomina phaseolina MS6]|uniref:Secreted protein n=1 Tax=Macrophomina phaseolina (strain MS6) TaxID=1126212 RepID=K2RNC6_MACPH|nr:hypothetical protein MPH_06640 [Macrophomina phaseolina MS6]
MTRRCSSVVCSWILSLIFENSCLYGFPSKLANLLNEHLPKKWTARMQYSTTSLKSPRRAALISISGSSLSYNSTCPIASVKVSKSRRTCSVARAESSEIFSTSLIRAQIGQRKSALAWNATSMMFERPWIEAVHFWSLSSRAVDLRASKAFLESSKTSRIDIDPFWHCS